MLSVDDCRADPDPAARELEAELREREEDLARTRRELEQLAYVVSHDLRAPVRGIGALVEWLAEDHSSGLSEDGRQQLAHLRELTARLHRMIDGILRYSRAARASEPRRIAVGALVSHVVDGLALPESAEVQVGELPELDCDESQLNQVFQNLIDNAVSHGREGRARVRIEIGAREIPGGVELWVRDDGPGIEAEHHERIFEIFRTLRPGDDGSRGVGLAIVKKIVEANGGRVRVESEPGRGATFCFSLPRARASS